MQTSELIRTKKDQGAQGVHSLIQSRFSPRVFKPEPLPEEAIAAIFEAARWAPSSSNKQPWYFLWAHHGSSGFEKIAAALEEGNQYARQAAILIVTLYLNNPDKPNDKAMYDLGQAVQTMILQAQSVDIHSRQMGGFSTEQLRSSLPLPDHATPVTVVAMGRIGDYTSADPQLLAKDEQPRKRKDNVMMNIDSA